VNVLTAPGGALDAAVALADKVCENAPLAVRESLAIVNRELNGDESGDWEHSHAAHARLIQSADMREGVTAFFERRSPQWQGR
jgi:enoyl-CoA hydratase/carnithine racemase